MLFLGDVARIFPVVAQADAPTLLGAERSSFGFSGGTAQSLNALAEDLSHEPPREPGKEATLTSHRVRDRRFNGVVAKRPSRPRGLRKTTPSTSRRATLALEHRSFRIEASTTRQRSSVLYYFFATVRCFCDSRRTGSFAPSSSCSPTSPRRRVAACSSAHPLSASNTGLRP